MIVSTSYKINAYVLILIWRVRSAHHTKICALQISSTINDLITAVTQLHHAAHMYSQSNSVHYMRKTSCVSIFLSLVPCTFSFVIFHKQYYQSKMINIRKEWRYGSWQKSVVVWFFNCFVSRSLSIYFEQHCKRIVFWRAKKSKNNSTKWMKMAKCGKKNVL